jgi:hypothetical protein
MSPILPNPSVLRCELVSLATEPVPVGVPQSASLVDSARHGFEMNWVDAGPVSAQVVEGQFLGYRADDVLVDPSMSLHDGVLALSALGPVAVSFTAWPVNTHGEHRHSVPVWDIGVEETHEFIANGIVVHNCMKDTSNPIDGWLDPAFIEQKKREIPAEMWRVEYELGEPSIGNRAMDSEAVERTFSLPTDTIRQKVAKDYEEYQFELPRQDREYVISADWAQAKDFTVITVTDCTYLPTQVVYWLKMRRRPYPVMIGKFNKLMKAYNAEGIHDATGLGAVVADYVDRRARGFQMVGAQRDNMLSEYISAVENDRIRAPRINSFYKSHLYTSVEMVYSRAKEFHLPDDVCSMALGWRQVSKRAVPAIPQAIKGTNDPTWIEKEMQENHDAQRKDGGWVIGGVQNKSETVSEFDLMV